MDLEIKINMDNAAFEDINGQEAARILRKLADKIDGGSLEDGDSVSAIDINGNKVGRLRVKGD